MRSRCAVFLHPAEDLHRDQGLDRVVEGPQVRVDLLREVAGKVPQAFSRLHDGPGDDELAACSGRGPASGPGPRRGRSCPVPPGRRRRRARALDGLQVEGLVVGPGIDLPQAVGDDDEIALEDLDLLVLAAARDLWRVRMRSGPGSWPRRTWSSSCCRSRRKVFWIDSSAESRRISLPREKTRTPSSSSRVFRLMSFAPQISGRIVSSLTTTVSGFSIQLPP